MANYRAESGYPVTSEDLPWLRVSLMLSLDSTRAFWQVMGLEMERPETLVGLLRDALNGRLGGSRIDATRPLTVQQVDLFRRSEISALLLSMNWMDDGSGDRLAHWVRTTYSGNDNDWCRFMRHSSGWFYAQVDEEAVVSAIRAEYMAAVRVDDVERDLRSGTLFESRWDRVLAKREGYPDVHPELDWYPVFDDVILTVRVYRFQRFWRRIRDLYGEEKLALPLGAAGRGEAPPF